jgi:deoxycitidine kinase/deoxyguanosine kinase
MSSFESNQDRINYMMMPAIISLEGNIGAGKTTLLEHLRERYPEGNEEGILFLKEPVDLWEQVKDGEGETMLSKFYADSVKYAFPFQIMAYASRLKTLRELVLANPGARVVVCERSLEADKHIFAKMLHDEGKIEDVCYQIYEMFFGDSAGLFRLSGVIYVDSDAEVCAERIAKRAREGETIPLDYLRKCREYHEAWLRPRASDGLQQKQQSILHLNTNMDATYVGESDPGVQWLNHAVAFIAKVSR